MKLFKLLLILLFSTTSNLFAQVNENIRIPQQKATPYEGMEVFYSNFIQEFKAPRLPKNVDQIKALIKFTVEKDGSFSDIKIIADSDEVSNELKRALETMPKWKPAYLDGEVVRTSFNLPVTVKVKNDDLSNDESDFLKDLATYEIQLKKYEQVTDSFRFFCNCVTSSVTTEPDGSSEVYVYETLDDIGIYTISISNLPQKEQKKFFKDLVSGVKKSGVNYKKMAFGNLEGLSVYWIEKIEEKDVYFRTFFFFEGDRVFTLNFGADNSFITDVVFTNLLNNFQIKN